MTELHLNTPHGKIFAVMTGEDAIHTPVLVINGGPGAAHGYLRRLEVFAEDRPVIFYDQLGTGQSDRAEDPSIYTVERGAEEIRLVREALGLEQVHIYSHSAGSAYAIRHLLEGGTAQSHVMLSPMLSGRRYNEGCEHLRSMLSPEDQLTLSETESSPTYSNAIYPQGLPEAYVELTQRFASQHWCRTNPPPQEVQDAFGSIESDLYQTMYGPEFFFIKGSLMAAEEYDSLHMIGAPTCIISGEFDWITLDQTTAINEAIPVCEHHVLSNSAHLALHEASEEHDARVGRFFERIDTGS